ncbi:hypothetical protein C0989_000263 [Termitomyces sp. Mn162]|nr:hypothetical protein C0989_000263 [Termitomyces sp. Mn162]
MFAIEEPQFLLGSNAATANEFTLDKAFLTSVDPIEAYIDLLPHEEEPVVLTITKDSQLLYSVMMLIDNKEEVECITDSGSQIILMSVEVASKLGLFYDPNIVLNMQSANGPMDQLLGLACNVPCIIGDITVYLQIHVLQSPIYNIHLGHPFDVLTQSVVNTLSDIETTITIMDPNTGMQCTILTFLCNTTPTYINIPFPAQFVANEPPKQKGVQVKKKYKPATMKTKPVTSHVSKDFKIEQHIIGDPLATMPQLDPNSPPFVLTQQFTSKQQVKLVKDNDTGFLTSNEINVLVDTVTKQDKAFA